LDSDTERVHQLSRAIPPVAEPGLAELLAAGLAAGLLRFTSEYKEALSAATVLWIAYDTPISDADEADSAWVVNEIERARAWVLPNTLVLLSSQLPAGTAAAMLERWRGIPGVQVVSAPENLRLGSALAAFRDPERVVIGLDEGDPARVQQLFSPWTSRLEFMSTRSAEMSKHALNAYLAVSASFANELARICERVGADATAVERSLRSDTRVGRRAYVTAGPPVAGGTLLRDVSLLRHLAAEAGLASPLLDGALTSNQQQAAWVRQQIEDVLGTFRPARAALLGLTYKAGTDTLRRSSALELAAWLAHNEIDVSAFDPAITAVAAEWSFIRVAHSLDEVLDGADVVIVATAWPQFACIDADLIARAMRRTHVVDEAGILSHLAADSRVNYRRLGRPRPAAGGMGAT
jgi:UDPglucose 6-dehydrogenase